MRLRHSVIALLAATVSISCSDSGPTAPGGAEPSGEDVVSREIGPEGGEITSQDGDLTLIVPEGALAGTETLTIGQLGEDDLGEAFDDVVDVLGVDGAWELGPDGLEFQEAVTARITSDQTPVRSGDSVGVSAEFLFTLDDGSVAALDSPTTAVDTATDEVVVSGKLSHFTPLVTSKANNGVSFFVFDVPETRVVDDPFDVRAVVGESTAGPLADVVALQGPAQYTDDSGSPLAPEFSPPTQDLEFVEEDEEGAGSGSFRGDFTYVCTDTGLGVFDADLSAEVTFDLASGTVTAESFAGFLTTVECVEEMPETVALTVQKDGDGAGTVVSQPDGISCGSDCQQQQAEFDRESSVILAAEAADGSVFDGWSGDIGDADPGASTLTLTMDAARTVTATFSTEDAGGGAPQVSGFTAEPTSPTAVEFTSVIEFTGPIGSMEVEFDWGDGESDVVDDPEETGEDEFTATMEYDYGTTGAFMPMVTATDTETGESDSESLELEEVTVTVEKAGDGEGTVVGETGLLGLVEFIDCGPGCESDSGQSVSVVGAADGLPVLLSADAEEGSVFVGWSGDVSDGEGCGGTGDCLFPAADRTVTATFEPEGDGNESCTEQPLEAGARFPWGGRVRELDDEGSTNVRADVAIDGVAELVPGTEDADRGTWTTFTPTEGVLDIGTTSGGEVIDFSFDVESTGAGTATYTFSASDEGGVRGTFICDFTFE